MRENRKYQFLLYRLEKTNELLKQNQALAAQRDIENLMQYLQAEIKKKKTGKPKVRERKFSED